MHAPVLTATPSTAVNQVARIMFEERVGAMPIADEAGNLVGMITRNDILRTLVSKDRLHL
jgi:CBS domain-containing protein